MRNRSNEAVAARETGDDGRDTVGGCNVGRHPDTLGAGAVISLLLLAAAPVAPPALQDWSDCLLEHAQVEAEGPARDIVIALDGLKACAPERDRYAKALIQGFARAADRSASPASRTVVQLREDQDGLVRRMLAFIRRMRER